MGFTERIDIAIDYSYEVPRVILNGTEMSFESADDAKFIFALLNDFKNDSLVKEASLSKIKKELSEIAQRIVYDEL
jgi:hypothetical protein